MKRDHEGVHEARVVHFLKKRGYDFELILETCEEPCLNLSNGYVRTALREYPGFREYEREERIKEKLAMEDAEIERKRRNARMEAEKMTRMFGVYRI